MKKIVTAFFLVIISISVYAQSGTNSPYSQYGLGVLSDQTSGFNRGMNGLGYGFRENDQVNYINPASYSALDSLTFIFDVGASGQLTHFEEGNKKLNAKNADLEYVVAGLRLAKHLGLSFGLLPLTNIGYNYTNTKIVSEDEDNTKTRVTNTFSGSGGLHQVYVGVGWEPLKGFSLGANMSYVWGKYNRSMESSFNDMSVNTISKYYTAVVRNYKLDLGLQYAVHLAKKDRVTMGVTYSLGHQLNADPELNIISQNPQTNVRDTIPFVLKNGLELPSSFGIGISWNHRNKFQIGVDYLLQQWAKIAYPVEERVNGEMQYLLKSGMFNDRHKLTVGGEYCQNTEGRRFLQRIRYRIGVSYATPYLKINNQDGPKEISMSAGFGIPIVNTWNNRSMLNISAQWVKQDAKQLITENTFRINIGLTFNERWFAKWKVQ